MKRARVLFSAGVPSTRVFVFARNGVEGARRGEESAPPKACVCNTVVNYSSSAVVSELKSHGQDLLRLYYVQQIAAALRGHNQRVPTRVFKYKKWYEGSFTARYRFDMLVYFEAFSNPSEAIEREKEFKGWRREKKLRLILAVNPDWAE